jgi:transcriptional regulator with XRE-family HTH domain
VTLTVKPRSPRTGQQRVGQRRARQVRQELGAEIAALRESSGLTMRALALAAGISPSTQAGIENGTHSPSIEVIARVANALGAGLGVRLYPGTGPRIYDHVQAAMLKALLLDLHPRWRRSLEVPLRHPTRGVIDLVLEDAVEPAIVACEAQSQLRRLEQQIRWASMKADALSLARTEARARAGARRWAGGGAGSSVDGESTAGPEGTAVGTEGAAVGTEQTLLEVSRLLLLRSTRTNRHVVMEHADLLAVAYPASHADLLAALCGTAPWPGPGLVWCGVDAAGARILDRPPRGVRLGR